MKHIPVETILGILRANPEGVTTAEMAMRLGRSRETISSRLSKLALYGKIDREILPRKDLQAHPAYLYRAKIDHRTDIAIQRQADETSGTGRRFRHLEEGE